MNPTAQTAASRACGLPDAPPVSVSSPQGPSERFLESLQHRVYSAVGLTAADCQHREWVGQQTILPLRLQQKAEELSEAEFAHYRSAVLDALTRDELLPRPTAFERPHQYSILRGLKASIEGAAAQLSIDLPFAPVIGTLPTKLLEPLMVRVPGTAEVVLLIDGSLLTYVHLLAKAIAQAMPIELADGETLPAPESALTWTEAIDPDGRATQRFVELMLASLNGSAATAPAYAPEPAREQTVAALCECMELFVLAREYARLCEGHHLAAATERREAYGQSFDALVWTANQELQADALGLGLMLSAAHEKGESARLAFWSADILLASFGIIDRALMTLESEAAPPLVALQPTIFDRRRLRLRELMNQLDGGAQAASYAATLEPVLTTLSERFEVVLHEMHFGPQPRH